MKQKILCLIIAVFNAIILQAYDFEVDGIYYAIQNDEKNCVYVTKGDKQYKDDIVIPSTIVYGDVEYTVTGIGEFAFNQENFTLNSVTIPSSVTKIERFAFTRCTISSITLPNSVTEIGENAFQYSRLRSITLPNSITNIGTAAFADCSYLESVTMSNKVTAIGNKTFSGCSALKSILIPSSIAKIGVEAFYGCKELTSVVIPEYVYYIGSGAFEGCYKLNTITLSSSVPPVCEGLGTFCCSDNVARDRYDIYNYSCLHVPMGCKNAYSSAYEWRYFKKIKEDIEQNGKIYYTTLRINQGDVGYSEQNVKADEAYTIHLGALGTNVINSVTFNGEDVTEDIIDGDYTTPDIKGPSVISVIYENIGANIAASNRLNDVRVFGHDGELTVTNIDKPTSVNVYTVDGKLIHESENCLGTCHVTLNNNERYIVKVGDRAFKVAL